MNGEDVIVRISGYCVNTNTSLKSKKTELTQRVFPESSFNGRPLLLKVSGQAYQANTKDLHAGPFTMSKTLLSAVEG